MDEEIKITDTNSILPLKRKIRVLFQVGSIEIEKKGDLLDLFIIEYSLFKTLAAMLGENPSKLRKQMVDRFNYAKKQGLI